MAYTNLFSTAKSGAGSTNVVTTDTVDSSGCDLIVVHLGTFTDPTAGGGVLSDSKGNTWTPLTKHGPGGGGGVYSIFYYCESPTVGSGHTFTWTPGATYPILSVKGFSGGTASSFLSENGATANAVSTLSTGSVTPSEDNCLVIAGLTIDVGTSITINGGFTATVLNAGSVEGGGIAHLIQTSAAAANPAWSWTTNSPASASIAVFKAATGGGGGGVFSPMMAILAAQGNL